MRPIRKAGKVYRAEGFIGGRRTRVSLGTRDAGAASRLLSRIERALSEGADSPSLAGVARRSTSRPVYCAGRAGMLARKNREVGTDMGRVASRFCGWVNILGAGTLDSGKVFDLQDDTGRTRTFLADPDLYDAPSVEVEALWEQLSKRKKVAAKKKVLAAPLIDPDDPLELDVTDLSGCRDDSPIEPEDTSDSEPTTTDDEIIESEIIVEQD